MKTLHFDYYMQICYSQAVTKCHFTIKCIPKDSARQKVSNLKITLFPKEVYSTNEDSFGNGLIYGHVADPHEEFSFRITGDVKTGQADYEERANEDMVSVFRHPYGLNRAGESLRSYFKSLEPELPQQSAYGKGVYLMHRLYQDYNYEKNCTTMKTTAEEAWKLGRGVCQDYAHILTALCHMAGIPARYVTGMLIGEGFSHAWVEILEHGKWYGIDPTNDTIVTDSHIKIGVGRDASDCLINRGVMMGGGDQSQNIRVSVEETEGELQHDKNSSIRGTSG